MNETQWCRDLLEKWIVAQLVEKFFAFMDGRLVQQCSKSPPVGGILSHIDKVHIITPSEFLILYFQVYPDHSRDFE
jgi:hypothetical protein